MHILASDVGDEIIKYLPATHPLTGADTTSKIGTKDYMMTQATKFSLLHDFFCILQNFPRKCSKQLNHSWLIALINLNQNVTNLTNLDLELLDKTHTAEISISI